MHNKDRQSVESHPGKLRRSSTVASRKRRSSRDTSAGKVDVEMVTLPAGCTIREAAVLRDALLAAVDVAGTIGMDGGAVERIDTAGLQLVAAFVRDRTQKKREVVWVKHSDALTHAVTLSGLGEAIGLHRTVA